MFIIVPCAIGVFTDRDKIGSLVGVGIGVLLLLCCRDILEWEMIWKLMVPLVIVAVGLKMVISGIFGRRTSRKKKKFNTNGEKLKTYSVTFGAKEYNLAGEVFDGAEISAVFGAIDFDLSGAIIDHDCAIEVSPIIGGIEIILPEHVRVELDTSNMFGVTVDKTNRESGSPTVYISGNCMFGGVEIK